MTYVPTTGHTAAGQGTGALPCQGQDWSSKEVEELDGKGPSYAKAHDRARVSHLHGKEDPLPKRVHHFVPIGSFNPNKD